MNSIGHKETAGLAAQVAGSRNDIIIQLHNAIEVLGRPGAGVPSTKEAISLVASAFADIATLQAAQTYEADMLLERHDGGTLLDVKDRLLQHLVDTTKGMSGSVGRDEAGNEFPVGALTRHYQEQLADTYAQAVVSLDNIIATRQFVDEIKEMFGDNVIIFNGDEEPDEDRGNVPGRVERSPVFYATSDGQSPRAG